jgi:hypothetical protein
MKSLRLRSANRSRLCLILGAVAFVIGAGIWFFV